MIALPLSLAAWHTEAFQTTLKAELKSLPAGSLPLEKGTQQAGLVDDSDLAVTLIRSSENEGQITVLSGIFFSEIVSGCSCGDEPTMSINAYCEVQLRIDKKNAHLICDAV